MRRQFNLFRLKKQQSPRETKGRMTTIILAFHNEAKIKEFYLARVQAHAIHDEIVQGKYWEHGKGCLVGCAVHSDSHQAFEDEMGIQCQIALLADRIFE